jgi:hypothetical protein
MPELDSLETVFVVWAFLFQLAMIIHFGLRKWRFAVVARYGWVTYLISIPAVVVSIVLLVGGKSWSLWLGGFICFVWAMFGYRVEFIKKIRWRNPPYWPIFAPYLLLYLATVMFYWFPLGLLSRPVWTVYAVLFIASTVLNATSHKGTEETLV